MLMKKHDTAAREDQHAVPAGGNWLQTRTKLERQFQNEEDSSHPKICHGSESPQSIKEIYLAIFCKMEVTLH